ncbi:hypothetical protein M23134_07811 [Microscilla marina ATCC 23134]|uniref:Uncharacterized protein n=1 Tax=Microscilla marina ATCC 23134 TaxID=313606 RepID=A1ZLF9_MICM2|nr:hypothetical protein M23134_07811 [Microscilla marina ATCC 23134]
MVFLAGFFPLKVWLDNETEKKRHTNTNTDDAVNFIILIGFVLLNKFNLVQS